MQDRLTYLELAKIADEKEKKENRRKNRALLMTYFKAMARQKRKEDAREASLVKVN